MRRRATRTPAEVEEDQMSIRRTGRAHRWLASLAAIGAIALVTGALPASAVAQDGDKVTIAIPGWAFSLNPQIAAVAQQYNDEHPNQPPIELTLNPTAQDNLDTSKFLAEAKEGKSSFDAWFGMTPFIDLTKLVEGGVLQPWDGLMPDAIKSDINPANLQEGTYSDGKLYSWPQVASAMLLAYRPSMFQEAGLADPPVTWDDVITDSTAIENAMPGTNGIVFDTRTWRSLIPLAVSFAGDTSPFLSCGYLDLSSPAAQKAVETLVALGKHAPPDILTPTGDVDAFKSSLAAMMLKYVDAAGTAARVFGQDDIALAPLPKPTADAKPLSVQWGTGFGLFKYAAHKDIAVDFVSYLTNSEAYQRGWLDAAQSSVYKSWQEKLAPDMPAWMAGQAEALASSTFIPPSADFVQWHTIVKPWIEKAITGELSSADALKGAADEVKQTLGDC
jgi:ABC-type glycerol-3-phosphate transport system substrate-binding protein